MDSEFEQRLCRQPVKKIPTEWRAEILAATRAAHVTHQSSPAASGSWFSPINSKLSTFFWPHPKAWAALATVWVFIFVLNFSMRDRLPIVAEKYAPPSPEVQTELRQQRLLFAELMGSTQPHDADRPKLFTKPRSERVEFMTT